MKIQIRRLFISSAQRPDKEIFQLIFFCADHRECCVKKLRQDNKVHCNIILSGRKDLLHCILIQKQKVTLFEHNLIAVHDMCRCSLAHINYFYIIVCMRREMYKASMRSDLNQLPLLQKFRTVHNHFLLFCIKLWIDLLFSFKDPAFLICDHRQFPDQFLMHLLPAFLVYPFNVAAISLVNSMYSFALLLLFLYAITGALLSCDHSIPLSTRM